MYQSFAVVYESLMEESLYQKWFDFSLKHLSSNRKTLELGCGSGKLAIMLEKKGFSMYGLDLSQTMLTLARENQILEGIDFPLIERSMEDLTDLGSFDQVICYTDALCYLNDFSQVKKVFSQVYKVLETEGTFIFDVHSIKKIQDFDGFSYHGETDEGLLVWDSYMGEHFASVEHDLSIFLNQKQDKYTRYDELHKERTYPYKDFIEALKEAGFTNVEKYSDFNDFFDENGDRWFFVATK